MPAQFIYRGVPYTPQGTASPRKAADLMWRGAKHDGTAASRPTRTTPVNMVYRGVAYMLFPRGSKVVLGKSHRKTVFGGAALAH